MKIYFCKMNVNFEVNFDEFVRGIEDFNGV